MKLSGSELLKLNKAVALNSAEIQRVVFTGVSIDSRNCKKSEVFFAIKGERFDGHSFVRDVLKKGIRAVVVQKNWYRRLSSKEKRSLNNKKILLVTDTIKSFGELAGNYRRKFVIPVLAVAGSNGKTSTKDFITRVLSEKYKVLKTIGNRNNAIGVPLTLFELNDKHDFCVIEVGTNHFGEIDYLCSITEPQFGLITNIGKEHLEFFKDLKGVTKAECELTDYLSNNFGTFFLNIDDNYLITKTAHKEMSLFTYGSVGKADVKGKILKFKGFYPEIEIKCGKKIINTVLNTIGSQSFNSALCAAAVGFYFDVPPAKIKKALNEFNTGTGKRNQLINANGVWIIDDTYNSNPDSVVAAIENLKKYKTKGSKHIVLSDMLELGNAGKEEHKNIGSIIKKMKFENLYTYGPLSLNTFKAAEGIKNNYYFSDKESLNRMLQHVIKKDDIVLVKGSNSMHMDDVVKNLIHKKN